MFWKVSYNLIKKIVIFLATVQKPEDISNYIFFFLFAPVRCLLEKRTEIVAEM